VTIAEVTLNQQIGGHMLISDMARLYYYLTAHIPRPMPESKEDLERLKEIFIKYYGLEDSPTVWYTVFANIASVKANKITNIAKRLDINKLLQDQKQIEYQKQIDSLEKAKVKDEQKESHPTEPIVPEWPSLSEGALDSEKHVFGVQESQR
jgi:uncharacterized protein YerC